MQLIILGMHRSGTSVLARLLNLMGVYFGPEGISTGANKENPKGFWERRDVRVLNDYVLHSIDCDWDRVLGFDASKLPDAVASDFTKRASRLVLEMDAHRPWLLKEPRLCLLLPMWRKVLEMPVCVHIFRNPVEVAASLRTRNGIPMKAGLALWEKYVRSATNASSGLPDVVVLHRQLMQEPKVVAEQLIRQFVAMDVQGLRMPSDREISTFVRDELYRERESRQDLAPFLKAPQMALFKSLTADTEPLAKVGPDLPLASRKVLAEYESGLAPLKKKQDEPVVSQSELLLRGELSLREQEAQMVREFSAKLDSELKQRDARLAFMEEECRTARDSAAKLQAALDQSNERFAASDKALHLLSEQSAQRERDLEQRDERLTEMEKAARAASDSLAQLDLELKQARAAFSSLEEDHRAACELAQKQASDLEAQEIKLAFHETEARAAALEHARLASELKRMAESKAALQRSVAERFREIEKLTLMLVGRDTELAAVHTENHDALVKLKARDDETLKLKEKLLVANRQIATMKQRVSAEKTANAQLESLLAEKSAELIDRESRLAEITSGVTWRMTAPLRATRRFFDSGKSSEASDIDTIRQTNLFESDWYLEHNPDVAESGMDPAEHYLAYGASEGRNPGPAFDSRYYLSSNPDVRESGMNPLVHYSRHGKAEGRPAQDKQNRAKNNG